MSEPRTPEDVAELMRQWSEDPSWDIENTEGYEAHRDELLIYRLRTENGALKNGVRRLEIDTSAVSMLRRIRSLEDRLAQLEASDA